MPLSPTFVKEYKSFAKNLSKFKDTLILEINNNKDDKEALSFLGRFDIYTSGCISRLNKIITPPKVFKPDQYVCTCLRNSIEENCVFIDDTILCDKKDDEGNVLSKKEDCPYWVKFSEINKPK